MSAFFVSSVDIQNKEKFAEYSQKAGASIVQYGGTRLIRGIRNSVLVGDADHNAVGVFKFADEAALDAWFNSDEYQAIVPLREEACKMSLVVYSDMD